MLIVLTGKTASGKDAVMSKLLEKLPKFRRVVSTTSRVKREGEVDGVDYNFISIEEFKNKITKGDFLEYVEYGGNFYGTTKSELQKDHDLIWRIDPSMAGKVEDATVIYLTVDDKIVLQRLKERGLTDQEIDKRMQDDKRFWEEYKNNYDYIVENVPGKLERAVDEISEIIKNNL